MLEQTNKDYLSLLEDLVKQHPDSQETFALSRALPGLPLDESDVTLLENLGSTLLKNEVELHSDRQIIRRYIKSFPYYEAFNLQRRGQVQRFKTLMQNYVDQTRSDINSQAYLDQYVPDSFEQDQEVPEEQLFEDTESSNTPVQSTGNSEISPETDLDPSLDGQTLDNESSEVIPVSIPLDSNLNQTTDLRQTNVSSAGLSLNPEATMEFSLDEQKNNSYLGLNLSSDEDQKSEEVLIPEEISQESMINNLESTQILREIEEAVQSEQEQEATAESLQANQQRYLALEAQRQEQLRQMKLQDLEQRQQARQEGLERAGSSNLAKRALIASIGGTTALLGGGLGLSIINILT